MTLTIKEGSNMTTADNDNKLSTAKPAAIVTGPFSRAQSGSVSQVVQDRVDRECKHPPTPYLRKDEPMHPYGLD
jgi:hypothetical protein